VRFCHLISPRGHPNRKIIIQNDLRTLRLEFTPLIIQNTQLMDVPPTVHEPDGLALDALLAETDRTIQPNSALVPTIARHLNAVQPRVVKGPAKGPVGSFPAVALALVLARDHQAQRRATVLRLALLALAQRDYADWHGSVALGPDGR